MAGCAGHGGRANTVQPLTLRGSWGAREANWQLGYCRLKSRLVWGEAEVKEHFLEEVTPERRGEISHVQRLVEWVEGHIRVIQTEATA